MSSRSSVTVDIPQNGAAPIVDLEKAQDGASKKLQVQVSQPPDDSFLVTLTHEEEDRKSVV